jgi:hypothetical protein
MRQFRQSARRLALATLLAIAGSPGFVPHFADDDAACVQLLVRHDENAHRVGASHRVRPAQHCVLCHTASVFRFLTGIHASHVAPECSSEALVGLSRATAARTAFQLLPSRAPPA